MRAASAGLSWRTAWKIAWRDVRASWTKFAFVIAAVALGVASLTGVRSFSLLFQRTLLRQARSIMAADLSARDFHPYTEQELAALDRIPEVRHTLVTETVSMASTPTSPDPLLVSLKAVDPAQYPYYGKVQLASGQPLEKALTPQTAVVSQEFLLRMRSSIGGTLHLGNSVFRIADVIRSEPDRISSSFGIGPRVMISQAALPATGLVRPGSRASERILFRLPPGPKAHNSLTIETLRKQVEAVLPDAQVADYREANPALAAGVNHATAMLTLISLVTMVLSAIGVGMAMHAHLSQRMETIAIMKALGARSGQIVRIYLLQTLFLGATGAVLGILAGALVSHAFALFLQRIISFPLAGNMALTPVLIGLGTGILTTLLFTVPPLLGIRGFRPLSILRRNVEQSQPAGAFRIMPSRDPVQLAAVAGILAGLAAIAMLLTDSRTVGTWFAAALGAVLVFLLLASATMLAGLRLLLRAHRARFSPAARQGLASLYRPGNQSAAVLSTLGVGVMLIATVYTVQHAIIRDLNGPAAANAPNVFLIDISPAELDGVSHLIAAQTGVSGALETIPVVQARILAVNGVSSDKLKNLHLPRRMLHSASLTWAGSLPPGEKVIAGRWWSDANAGRELAVSQHMAQLLHLSIGSTIEFEAAGRMLPVRVVALYRSDGEHLYARSQFILPPGALTGAAPIWYGGFHSTPDRIASIERALYAAYPTITVINVSDVMEVIRKAVDQIATILRFLAGFTILAGGIILSSSITASRLQRVREVAILKSLGALRSQIISMLTVEFAMLGAIAGAAGAAFATALSAVLLHRMDVAFHPGWLVPLVAVAGTAILASVSGWLASLRILSQKPLEVLREE